MLGQENLISCFSSRPHAFYPTTSNYIIAVINPVSTFFDASYAYVTSGNLMPNHEVRIKSPLVYQQVYLLYSLGLQLFDYSYTTFKWIET